MRPRAALRALALLGLGAACSSPSPPQDAARDRADDLADTRVEDTRPPPRDIPRSDGGLNIELVEERVFGVYCAVPACHSGDMPTGRMNLEPGRARESLLGVRARGVQCGATDNVRVVPGSAEMSLLVHKLEDPRPPCGAQMPLGSAPLDPELVALVRRWVEAGAP